MIAVLISIYGSSNLDWFKTSVNGISLLSRPSADEGLVIVSRGDEGFSMLLS